MKILCLTIILVNIILLMWEYRGGAFESHKPAQEQTALVGTDRIFLAHEQKKGSHPTLPTPTPPPPE
jgi:hypothetical protein